MCTIVTQIASLCKPQITSKAESTLEWQCGYDIIKSSNSLIWDYSITTFLARKTRNKETIHKK